ncbi:MAG TPA: flagellar hook-basal body protein [Lachnospiraceae bacterium]|nr:flagellar hook-basal body protein [Lachnospiraceae bacterium]
MIRSLWTAATGMIAQQNNIDTIANNLANVNTTGYKTEVAEFKSLLYQTLQTKTTSANGNDKPVGAQVGLGVRNSSITSIFTQGNSYESTSTSAFMIQGDGFFAVRGEDGSTKYTRNGNFNISMGTTGLTLTNSDGLPVLDSTGKAVVFNNNVVTSKITISADGEFYYPDANNNAKSMGIKLGVFQFNNPAGLEKTDSSLYEQTAASGVALNEATNNNVKKSSVIQGYLEGSNVQVVDEMVNMIVAQRAYEMNSKAIQASDEMLQQANQLRR